MDETLKSLKEILGQVADLEASVAVLEWDQQTYMPPGGADGRSMALSTVSRLAHESFIDDRVGELLSALEPGLASLDPDSDEARLVRVTRRQYDKARKVPAQFVAEFRRVTSLSFQTWQEARVRSNFALFRPHLERVVEMRRQYAGFFAPYDSVYDPPLDDHEPGMKTAELKAIFEALRPRQVKLIQAIAEKPPVDDSLLRLNYDEAKQWDFGMEVAKSFGYDLSRGREDRSAHPFTTGFNTGDVRITTRLDRNYLPEGMFGTFHETGHALYDQGLPQRLERTPIARSLSYAFHESQSRTWENLVGRSRPFWKHYYPRLQAYFPEQLGSVDLDTFYRAVNRVVPSFIRTEADEATYNLHIMLRLDLEMAFLEGRLAVADLPEAWASGMREYLGITPPDDKVGVLQDVHWSTGAVGYFPTYALGNLLAAQLWEKAQSDIPDLSKQIERGEFRDLLAWQRENVHQHGGKYEPMELIVKATGTPLTPEPYLRYLWAKYGEIYGL